MAKNETFEGLLAQKEALQKNIAELGDRISHLPHLQTLAMAAGEERARLVNFIQYNGGSEDKIPPAKREMLATYKERTEEAAGRYEAAKEKEDAMRAELAALKDQLSGVQCVCAEDELRGLQDKLAAVKAETQEAKARIQRIKAETEQARAAIPDIGHLKQKRLELIAKQALGQDVAAELQEIDSQIQNSGLDAATADVQARVAGNREVLAGLERLALENGKIAERLEGEVLPAARKSYLQARAEIVGEQYARAAGALLNSYTQLVAIGGLMGEHWEKGGGLRLPDMPVKTAEGVYERRHQLNIADAMAELRAALTAAGVLA